MEIISTGAADILLVDDLPSDAHSFEIQDNPVEYGKHVMMLRGIPDYECVYSPVLPEGYNYTILDRFESLSEEQCVELMPCGEHIEGLGYFMTCYGYFGHKYYLTAKEALTCFLQYEKGILLENPLGTNPYSMEVDQAKWQEAQTKVKNPLVIKAEKI